MKTVTYKGYQAAVEYEDGVLFVRVLHIDDLLVTQCKSVDEIDAALAELIEDYLEDCRQIGKEPSKAFSGSFNVRVGADLHRRAAVAAAEHGENLNGWITKAIAEKLECDNLGSRVDTMFAGARHELELLRLTSISVSSTHAYAPAKPRRVSIRPLSTAEAILHSAERGAVWAKLDG